MTNDEILNQYIESCEIIKKTLDSGDYKTGNKEGKKLIKVFKYLEKNVEQAKTILPQLFNEENINTRITSAAHCIALNIFVEESAKLLEIEAQNDNNGIFGFDAEMTLKVWREEGKLEVYQK